MRTLKFNVEGQSLKKDSACDFSGIVKGSKGYLQCSFSFSREWAGCKVAASFWSYDKEKGATPVVNVFIRPDVNPTVLPMMARPVPTILSYPRAKPIVTARG